MVSAFMSYGPLGQASNKMQQAINTESQVVRALA
jgi:hypothetical protein